jgi:hypothetical protein
MRVEILQNIRQKMMVIAVAFIAMSLTIFYSGLIAAQAIFAQDQEDGWQTPINLSQSGVATTPRIVVDAEGIIHIIWREDAVGRFFYTRSDEDGWRPPIPVELPFGTRRYEVGQVRPETQDQDSEGEIEIVEGETEGEATPTVPVIMPIDGNVPLFDPELIADSAGRIHAFWIDADDVLWHSSVRADGFQNFSGWTWRQQLSPSVMGFSAFPGNNGDLHLGYVQLNDQSGAPAGVYYRRLSDGLQDWSTAVPIYQSGYYRATTPETTSVKIVVGSSNDNVQNVYIVADNQPLEEVVFISSADGGQSWAEPWVVDKRRPEDSFESVGPSDMDLITLGDEIHLTWQAGHNTNCEQYHQWSPDNGTTWQSADVLGTGADGCNLQYQLITSESGLLFLLENRNGEVALQAWSNGEWSDPENQAILSSFVDPNTQRRIGLGCHQLTNSVDNLLLVVGCGSRSTIKDAWFLQRSFGDRDDWFPAGDDVWSTPQTIMAAAENLTDPLLLYDGDDRLHSFVIAASGNQIEESNAKIQYSYWENSAWSRSVPLLQLESAEVDQLSGVYDADRGPFLLWRDKQTNTYLFSVVEGDDILIPAEWSLAQPLLDTGVTITSPTPYMGMNNEILVVYAIPLNEERGIYILRTSDHGNTWSEPEWVFDAMVEGLEMVDRPQIAQGPKGDLHILYSVYSLKPEPVVEAAYYIRSNDEGLTWSAPKLIVEGNVLGSQIVSIDARTLLITWQQSGAGENQHLSIQSTDGGESWGRPQLIVEPDSLPAVSTLVTPVSGETYFIQLQKGTSGKVQVQERPWRENVWQAIEYHDLDINLRNEELLDVSAVITNEGHLMTIFNSDGAQSQGLSASTSLTDGSTSNSAANSNSTQLNTNKLLSTFRLIELSAGGITEIVLPPLTPAVVEDPDETVVAEPTSISESSGEAVQVENIENTPESDPQEQAPSEAPMSPLLTMLLAIVPVIVIIAGALGYKMYKSRQRI